MVEFHTGFRLNFKERNNPENPGADERILYPRDRKGGADWIDVAQDMD